MLLVLLASLSLSSLEGSPHFKTALFSTSLYFTKCYQCQKQTMATAHITLETMGPIDPWMHFLYALKGTATRDKYIQRLIKFLDFLGYKCTKEEKLEPLQLKQRYTLTTHSTVFSYVSILKTYGLRHNCIREEDNRKKQQPSKVEQII